MVTAYILTLTANVFFSKCFGQAVGVQASGKSVGFAVTNTAEHRRLLEVFICAVLVRRLCSHLLQPSQLQQLTIRP